MTRIAALGAAAILFVTGAAIRDVEAIAIAVGLLVGVGLTFLWGGGIVGRIVLGLLFADIVFWMAPAAWSNWSHGGSASNLLIPVALVVCSLAGLASLVGAPSRAVAVAGAVVLVAGLVVLPAISDDADDIPAESPSVLKVKSSGVDFLPSKLNATGAELTVVFHNKDLFWHTFTIDALDLNVRAPLGGTRVARFTASPGTYEFYCAIPGHEAAGMKGTLVVMPGATG